MTQSNSMCAQRDYQCTAVRAVLAAWARGVRAPLIVFPTGSGKTHVIAELVRRTKGRTLVLTDRTQLARQAAWKIGYLTGLSIGVEQGRRRVGAKLPRVVCATIQSISRPERLRRFRPDAFGLIVIDEADLGIAPSYRAVLEHFSGALRFGCTATPDRADGRTLGEVFDEVVARADMGDLIRAGYLSPLRQHLVRIESVSLEKVHRDDGDFSDAAMEKILTQERVLHEVVRPALDLAGPRPALVFATSVKHAEALADLFNRKVYRPGCARAIHGGMDDAEREMTIEAFKRRDFQFLVNCQLLLRGIDLPFVSCVVMARPTLSRALYAQALGRGTRVAEGKVDLLVLDFTDNSANHDLVSPIDVLAPAAPEEAKERAREILDEEQGADPLEVLDRAEAQLEADPALRERVRAKVEFRLQQARLNKSGTGTGMARSSINWDEQPLGKVPDRELALRLGVSENAVKLARWKRGLRNPGSPHKHINWDAVPDLGKVPDHEIARRLGVTQPAVQSARRARGIRSARHHRVDSLGLEIQKHESIAAPVVAERFGVHPSTVHRARARARRMS